MKISDPYPITYWIFDTKYPKTKKGDQMCEEPDRIERITDRVFMNPVQGRRV